MGAVHTVCNVAEVLIQIGKIPWLAMRPLHIATGACTKADLAMLLIPAPCIVTILIASIVFDVGLGVNGA